MKLSLRDFAEVMTILQGSSRELAADERRTAPRLTVSGKIQAYLRQASDFRVYTALARDLSLSGVGLYQSIPIANKTEVIVALPRARGPLHVVSCIMYCRPIADGVHSVGLEHARMVDDALAAQLAEALRVQHERIRQSVLES